MRDLRRDRSRRPHDVLGLALLYLLRDRTSKLGEMRAVARMAESGSFHGSPTGALAVELACAMGDLVRVVRVTRVEPVEQLF
jgi:hypothetical protein